MLAVPETLPDRKFFMCFVHEMRELSRDVSPIMAMIFLVPWRNK
jgi:hypothetical protein